MRDRGDTGGRRHAGWTGYWQPAAMAPGRSRACGGSKLEIEEEDRGGDIATHVFLLN
jgi:hypothetical protein